MEIFLRACFAPWNNKPVLPGFWNVKNWDQEISHKHFFIFYVTNDNGSLNENQTEHFQGNNLYN